MTTDRDPLKKWRVDPNRAKAKGGEIPTMDEIAVMMADLKARKAAAAAKRAAEQADTDGAE